MPDFWHSKSHYPIRKRKKNRKPLPKGFGAGVKFMTQKIGRHEFKFFPLGGSRESSLRGNRCGHNLFSPRFLIEENPYKAEEDKKIDCIGEKRRSRIQYKIIGKIQEYYNKPGLIPMLNAVNGSSRQQRSERREACVALLEAMVHSMDLVSLRVGYYGRMGEGDFIYRTMEWLSVKAGISLSRAKRALKDLKGCGILTVKKAVRKNPDNTYTGLASTKCFSKAFMMLLGFNKWLGEERKKAVTRKRDDDVKAEESQKRSPKSRATAIMMSSMLIDALTGGDWAKADDYKPIPDSVT